MYIKLDNLISFIITCIGNRNPEPNLVILLFYVHFPIPELCIGQTIAKRVEHLSVKILIGTLSLNDIVVIDIRKILVFLIPGHWKTCCRIRPSAQYRSDTCSKLLRTRCRIQNRPGLRIQIHNGIRIIRYQYNYGIGIDFQYLICEPLLRRRQCKCRTIDLLLTVNHRIRA